MDPVNRDLTNLEKIFATSEIDKRFLHSTRKRQELQYRIGKKNIQFIEDET